MIWRTCDSCVSSSSFRSASISSNLSLFSASSWSSSGLRFSAISLSVSMLSIISSDRDSAAFCKDSLDRFSAILTYVYPCSWFSLLLSAVSTSEWMSSPFSSAIVSSCSNCSTYRPCKIINGSLKKFISAIYFSIVLSGVSLSALGYCTTTYLFASYPYSLLRISVENSVSPLHLRTKFTPIGSFERYMTIPLDSGINFHLSYGGDENSLYAVLEFIAEGAISILGALPNWWFTSISCCP